MSTAVEISGNQSVHDTWNFDESFCKKILQNVFDGQTVKVLEIRCTSQANYLSDTFRLYVRWSTDEDEKRDESVFLFVKTEPSSEIVRTELVRAQGLFATELNVLRKVLPKMERILQRQLGPKLFYGLDDPKLITMEDLSVRNYITKDRQKGLPLLHCLLALQQLAKFHAASVAMCEKDPQSIRSIRGGILSQGCPKSFVRLIEVSLINMSRTVRTWQGKSWTHLADKMNKLSTTIAQRLSRIYDYGENEFCVLNHGDFWTTNILFQENPLGKPVDALMLDYQMSVYTSPAIDLLYFLNICPEKNLMCAKDDFLLASYLAALRKTMKAIGCKTQPPSMEELKHSMHERRIYGVMAGVVFLPRMMGNAEDTETFDVILKDLKGETRMDVFKNPDVTEILKIMLPIMDQRAYFD